MQQPDDQEQTGPNLNRFLPIAAAALGAIILLGTIFLIGQATRKSDSDVQVMIDDQSERDNRYHTRQRVKAVIAAKQDVRETWRRRARKDAKQAREQGEQAGYSSGSSAGFASGKEEGRVEGEVEGYLEGFDEGTCYDPYTYNYVC